MKRLLYALSILSLLATVFVGCDLFTNPEPQVIENNNYYTNFVTNQVIVNTNFQQITTNVVVVTNLNNIENVIVTNQIITNIISLTNQWFTNIITNVYLNSNDWVYIGGLENFYNTQGSLVDYPVEQYEYGFNRLGDTIHLAVCTTWNSGLRFYNLHPYFVESQLPASGMKYGGEIFYIGTSSSEDDTATSNSWAYGYWEIISNNSIDIYRHMGNFNPNVYVRRR